MDKLNSFVNGQLHQIPDRIPFKEFRNQKVQTTPKERLLKKNVAVQSKSEEQLPSI